MQTEQQNNGEETLTITVWLSGRSYRIRIKPDEESEVRKAIKIADQKVNELRTHYSGKDDQDFLAMCLLSYAGDTATASFSDPVINQEIKNLTQKIDRVLVSGPDNLGSVEE